MYVYTYIHTNKQTYIQSYLPAQVCVVEGHKGRLVLKRGASLHKICFKFWWLSKPPVFLERHWEFCFFSGLIS